jgi:hypothetical protein
MRFLMFFLTALTELSYAAQADASRNTYAMGNSSGNVFVTKLDPNGVVLFTNLQGHFRCQG